MHRVNFCASVSYLRLAPFSAQTAGAQRPLSWSHPSSRPRLLSRRMGPGGGMMIGVSRWHTLSGPGTADPGQITYNGSSD